ncbi:hypothetical protein, partial [Burkholderia multivorans]|uniref:hypothetical protein n=1 Tax=Burkholderia multivorans TaxID=87883 RepID=UPI0021BF6CA2
NFMESGAQPADMRWRDITTLKSNDPNENNNGRFALDHANRQMDVDFDRRGTGRRSARSDGATPLEQAIASRASGSLRLRRIRKSAAHGVRIAPR